eukprot:scaffold689_cov375-Prasinococcus_capsulatus_cf.AAC.27
MFSACCRRVLSGTTNSCRTPAVACMSSSSGATEHGQGTVDVETSLFHRGRLPYLEEQFEASGVVQKLYHLRCGLRRRGSGRVRRHP